MNRSILYEVLGVTSMKMPMMVWNQVVEKDMREYGLNKIDAQYWIKWRRLVSKAGHIPSLIRGENCHKTNYY